MKQYGEDSKKIIRTKQDLESYLPIFGQLLYQFHYSFIVFDACSFRHPLDKLTYECLDAEDWKKLDIIHKELVYLLKV